MLNRVNTVTLNFISSCMLLCPHVCLPAVHQLCFSDKILHPTSPTWGTPVAHQITIWKGTDRVSFGCEYNIVCGILHISDINWYDGKISAFGWFWFWFIDFSLLLNHESFRLFSPLGSFRPQYNSVRRTAHISRLMPFPDWWSPWGTGAWHPQEQSVLNTKPRGHWMLPPKRLPAATISSCKLQVCTTGMILQHTTHAPLSHTYSHTQIWIPNNFSFLWLCYSFSYYYYYYYCNCFACTYALNKSITVFNYQAQSCIIFFFLPLLVLLLPMVTVNYFVVTCYLSIYPLFYPCSKKWPPSDFIAIVIISYIIIFPSTQSPPQRAHTRTDTQRHGHP